MNESKKTLKDIKEEAIVAIVLCLLTATFHLFDKEVYI